MNSNYEVRAQKFIEQIFPYLVNCEDFEDYSDAVMDFMLDHPNRRVLFCHGIARIALVTSDYVVKIDYSETNVAQVGGCEAEVRFYQMAEQEGMTHLFAKISRFEYCGRVFYIMPRVYGIDKERWDYADAFMTDAENDWCMEHNLCDLHCGNYGFMNGRVVIFDYACYYPTH